MSSDDYVLPNGAPYFYLFAMGRTPRRDSNVHLAVQPYPEAVASIGSLYGVTFTIREARALRIDRSSESKCLAIALPRQATICLEQIREPSGNTMRGSYEQV